MALSSIWLLKKSREFGNTLAHIAKQSGEWTPGERRIVAAFLVVQGMLDAEANGRSQSALDVVPGDTPHGDLVAIVDASKPDEV